GSHADHPAPRHPARERARRVRPAIPGRRRAAHHRSGGSGRDARLDPLAGRFPMRAILPPWTDPDPALHARLGDVIDPDRKVLAADDACLAAIAEAMRVLRPGGRLIVMGYYGRDDVGALLDPEVVRVAHEATQRRTGWWLRHDFKIKVVHARFDLHDEATAQELLIRLYGD